MDIQFLLACVGTISIFVIPILILSICGLVKNSPGQKGERYVSIKENQFLYPQHWETSNERKEREMLANIEERQRLMWYKDFFKKD